MSPKMVVYESDYSKTADPEDFARFEDSVKRLAGAGIVVERIMCEGLESIPKGTEAFDEVKEEGMEVFPITEYEGAIVFDYAYPDDQTLADFLDVPDGVLKVNRVQPPGMNDLPPACSCGTGGAKIPKKE